MEQYSSIQQLLKKEDGHKYRKPIYPPTVIQAVFEGKTGASLEAILAQFNSVYVQYQGTPKDTRLIIPKEMRRAGLTITYMDMDSNTITERANSAVQKDNDHWGLDVNWSRVDELSLSGDISVSAKGTWIINGKDTGVKALGPKGDTGLTPWLKTIDNKLHFSYDNVTWEPCSENIAAWFRWNDNKIQISRDNKTWTDLSGKFADNVHIKGYVANYVSLPTGAVQGDIYGVGPTYAAEDTAHTNPIYRYYVRNANTWVDNGSFTSLSAGVVQETGNSETEVMSQKAVSEKLSELGSDVSKIYINKTETAVGNGLTDITTFFVVSLKANVPFKYKYVAVTDVGYSGVESGSHTFMRFYRNDGGFFGTVNAVPGDIISAGTIIAEGTFTPSEDGSASFHARLTEGSIVDVFVRTGKVADIESEISSLKESLDEYKPQINKAKQLGYKSTNWRGALKPLVFMHISDTHGSDTVKTAINTLNVLGKNGYAKFLLHTGDCYAGTFASNNSVWNEAIKDAEYPIFVVAGNHDVGNQSVSTEDTATDSQYYDAMVAPLIDKWNLKTDGGGTPHFEGRNYYFTDFTESAIRFIGLYEFESDYAINADGNLVSRRGYRAFRQEQVDWLIDALLTTPENYGVVIAKHMPDNYRGSTENNFNSKDLIGRSTMQTYQGVDMLADIVQAFIDGTTINKQYPQTGGVITTLKVEADFSIKNAGAEFVCYCDGHTHADGVNFLRDYPRQLDLNVNCDNYHYQHYSDIELSANGIKDAINVYSIDRNFGLIHIVRIGADFSAEGDKRDCLTINYRKNG